MTKVLNARSLNLSFGHYEIDYWNLFGAWDLVIGIYLHCHMIHTL